MLSKTSSRHRDYGENSWHPDRAPIRINGPSCDNCHRPLIVTEENRCLCCGKEQ